MLNAIYSGLFHLKMFVFNEEACLMTTTDSFFTAVPREAIEKVMGSNPANAYWGTYHHSCPVNGTFALSDNRRSLKWPAKKGRMMHKQNGTTSEEQCICF